MIACADPDCAYCHSTPAPGVRAPANDDEALMAACADFSQMSARALDVDEARVLVALVEYRRAQLAHRRNAQG